MERELTCIVCPIGCALNVQLNEKSEVLSVQGNTCPRGEKYARTECTDPRRVLTTTVRCEDGSMLSVKTAESIPKDKLADVMTIINRVVAKLPVRVGDVIVEDVFGSKVVATQNHR